jgi:hypothetical protein
MPRTNRMVRARSVRARPAKISLAVPIFGANPSVGQIIGELHKFGSTLQGQKSNSCQKTKPSHRYERRG